MKLIGDLHGNISFLKNYIAKNTDETPTIIMGDVGWGFQTDIDKNDWPSWLKAIRGNHDDPEVACTHNGYLGDYGQLADGKIFYMSGANSVDKAWRLEYHETYPQKPKIWWEEEELSEAQLSEALDLYRMLKPDIVLTHDAPFLCHTVLKEVATLNKPDLVKFGSPKGSRTSRTLDKMFEIHQPKQWIFGHWHCSTQFKFHLTSFKCLDVQEVFNLGDINVNA